MNGRSAGCAVYLCCPNFSRLPGASCLTPLLGCAVHFRTAVRRCQRLGGRRRRRRRRRASRSHTLSALEPARHVRFERLKLATQASPPRDGWGATAPVCFPLSSSLQAALLGDVFPSHSTVPALVVTFGWLRVATAPPMKGPRVVAATALLSMVACRAWSLAMSSRRV